MRYAVELLGREELQLDIEMDQNGTVLSAHLAGVGGPQLLKNLPHYRSLLKGSIQTVALPVGSDISSLLMRELLLRVRGQFDPPYKEEELCHCRGIPTKVVNDAIVAGAHTPQKVSRLTSASTACGTCRPDVQAMINYRLGQKAS